MYIYMYMDYIFLINMHIYIYLDFHEIRMKSPLNDHKIWLRSRSRQGKIKDLIGSDAAR